MMNRLNTVIQFNRLMDFESREINKITKAQAFIFGGEMSYTLNNEQSFIFHKIRSLSAHTFNVIAGDLKGCSFTEFLERVDTFANSTKKFALVHRNGQKVSLLLFKLLARLNDKLTIVHCGNQDIDAAFTGAKSVQLVVHDDIESNEVEASLSGSESIVGVLIINDEVDLAAYRTMLRRIWEKVNPAMVSIGIVLDTSLDIPCQLQVISCRGRNSPFPNLVEVEDPYVADSAIKTTNKNGEIKCVNATVQGTGNCINEDEYYAPGSLYEGRCSSCDELETSLSVSEQEGYFDNMIKLHEDVL